MTRDELRDHYELSDLKPRGRGLLAAAYKRSTNVRLLKPELAQKIQDDAPINAALDEYLRLKQQSA